MVPLLKAYSSMYYLHYLARVLLLPPPPPPPGIIDSTNLNFVFTTYSLPGAVVAIHAVERNCRRGWVDEVETSYEGDAVDAIDGSTKTLSLLAGRL